MSEVTYRDGHLFSTAYDDYYHSKKSAKDEAEYVFVQGNDLPNRWPTTDDFSIGELGFGTGLNFIVTLSLWTRQNRDGTLHYVAFEQRPFGRAELARVLAPYDGLQEETNRFLALWPDKPSGHWVHIRLRDLLAELTVVFGDVTDTLESSSLRADAWYLDGFSPAKNPAMWSAPLMCGVFDRTAPGGTLATYTAAGHVRRHLERAGFAVEKRAGFAGKREMLTGRRRTD